MVNLPSLISLTTLAIVGLAPHRPSRLFGKLEASRHLIAPCAIAGVATATAPLVAARRAKFRREIVIQSSLMLRCGFAGSCDGLKPAAFFPGSTIAKRAGGRSDEKQVAKTFLVLRLSEAP